MQRALAMRKLSVRPSVKRQICDKTKESCAYILTPYERSFILVFWEECVAGETTSTWNFRPTGPRWSVISRYSLVSPQR